MTTTPTLPTLTTPRFLDQALAEINTKLAAGLSWLDSTFGRAEHQYQTTDLGRELVFPAVHIGRNEYLKLFPDSHIGNFSFWDIEDGQGVDYRRQQYNYVEADFGLVLWFHYGDVYGATSDNYTIENVKADVLRVLTPAHLANSSIEITEFFENKENVYRGYDIRDIDNQFWMRPYGCLRIDGRIRYRETCTP